MRSPALSDGDRAAIGLLREYAGGYWLTVPEFESYCMRLDPAGDPYVDWNRTSALVGLSDLSRCDVAVLLTALHLGGQDLAGMALGSWLPHLTRQALAGVVRAIAIAAGARAQVKDLGDYPLLESTVSDHG